MREHTVAHLSVTNTTPPVRGSQPHRMRSACPQALACSSTSRLQQQLTTPPERSTAERAEASSTHRLGHKRLEQQARDLAARARRVEQRRRALLLRLEPLLHRLVVRGAVERGEQLLLVRPARSELLTMSAADNSTALTRVRWRSWLRGKPGRAAWLWAPCTNWMMRPVAQCAHAAERKPMCRRRNVAA